MRRGAIVLVVGPSGAGKDTLIACARRHLDADERFMFPRRVVTREAVTDVEDHDSLTPAQFELKRRCGAFALDWEAHGLSYGLPAASIEAALLVGRVVVANVSRSVILQAVEKYPACHTILISAPPAVRAARLAMRGRESTEQIAARLAREGPTVPSGVFPTVIDNSNALEDGVRRFRAALLAIAG